MAITDWSEYVQPRERLLAHGAASLSDAELLAICLSVGCKGKSAVDLGRELISRFGGLNGLVAATQPDFSAGPGMGRGGVPGHRPGQRRPLRRGGDRPRHAGAGHRRQHLGGAP